MTSAITASDHIVNGATTCIPYSTFIVVRSPGVFASNCAKSVCAMSMPSCFALLRLAQRLLLDAARPGALVQFGDHVGRRQSVARERDHAVEPEVRDLGHDLP